MGYFDGWKLKFGVVGCLNRACWAGDHGSVDCSFLRHGRGIGCQLTAWVEGIIGRPEKRIEFRN